MAAKKPRGNRGRRPEAKAGVWVCTARGERERVGLTLQSAAEAIGIGTVTLHKVEHGGDVQLVTAAKIAAFYGKKIEELWPRRGDGKERGK